jgi:acyl carrier protein
MDMDALTERVCATAASVFNLEPDAVTRDSTTDTIEQWDSLGRLVLVLELEQTFGVALPPEIAAELTSVRAIVATLERMGVAGAETVHR